MDAGHGAIARLAGRVEREWFGRAEAKWHGCQRSPRTDASNGLTVGVSGERAQRSEVRWTPG